VRPLRIPARLLLSWLLLGWALLPAVGVASDQDLDGLDDDWELGWFGSIALYAGGDDPDRDELINLEEQEIGSDPTHVDSDDDQLLDGEEQLAGTDPLDADSDADGLDDHAELEVWGSDPLVADSDGGGSSDGDEVLIHWTDPLDRLDDLADSDGDGLSDALEAALGSDPGQADSDADWIPDGDEDADQNGRWAGDLDGDGCWEAEEGDETDPLSEDSDGDALSDGWEVLVYLSDPFDTDTDDDALADGDEHAWRYRGYVCLSLVEADSDGDSLDDGEELEGGLGTDACGSDSDRDGVLDPVELQDGTDPMDPDSAETDSDGDGLSDRFEAAGGTDPYAFDSDGDGLYDAEEVFPLDDGFVTDPDDVDSDDDGILDGNEGGILEAGELVGGLDPSSPDSDGDGLLDGVERGLTAPESTLEGRQDSDFERFQADADPTSTTDPLDTDSDGDGRPDGSEDRNGDGICDPTETCADLADTDGDGLPDGWEWTWGRSWICESGTVPLDGRDPDDAGQDGDADGLSSLEEYDLRSAWGSPTCPCKPDTDDDGNLDGQEVGGRYSLGSSDPTVADSDGDGLLDGQEDADGDGLWEPEEGETDPTLADSDGDGLVDMSEDLDGDGVWEPEEGETDPLQADTDGDGLGDGQERLQLGTDPLLSDTDGDGLDDGVETGASSDSDPSSRTDPLLDDTDGDGLLDGEEDADGDGAWDAGETHPADADTDRGGVDDGTELLVDGTDPLDPSDDGGADRDGDGLLDDEELLFGTDPYDVDSDDDGLWDGLEVGWVGDADPSTTTDPLDPDTDGDGLGDGLEDANGDGARGRWEVDPLRSDSDGDGLSDGREDLDGDGWMGLADGETDPREADTDADGADDALELEAGTDALDRDTDGDSIRDGYELTGRGDGPPDWDGDGVLDALDSDSDDDLVDDAVEAGDDLLNTPPEDSDGDGTADFRDTDSDNGGVDDGTELRVHDTDPKDPSDDGRGWLEDDGLVLGGAGRACAVAGGAPGVAAPLSLSLVLLAVGRRRRSPRPRAAVRQDPSWASFGLLLLLALALLVLGLLPSPVLAQVQHPDAQNSAVDANPFRLDPAGLGVLSTGSGRVLEGMELHSALTMQQVARPVVVASATDGELLRPLVDDRSQLDLALGFGLGQGFELAAVLPVVLHQVAQPPGQKLGELSARGFGDLRLRGRLGLVSGRRGGLALSLPVSIPTGDDQAWMGSGGFGAEPQLVASLDLGPVELASALGYRAQPRSTVYTMVDGHKLLARAGGRLALPDARWAVAGEAWGTARAGAPFRTPGETTAEALLAAQVEAVPGLWVTAGGGGGLVDGVSSSAWRALVGLSWGSSARPDRDEDGVPLSRDLCPEEREDWDSFEDHDGCPDLDDDGDGLADEDDACRDVAEDFDEFEDQDGCPEIDNDGDGWADRVDECPLQAEDLDGIEDEDGCPDEEPEPETVEGEPAADGLVMVERIEPEPLGPQLAEIAVHFDFGSTSPGAAGVGALFRLLELVREHPEAALIIEGHTDSVGSASSNQRVSLERAEAVRAWLLGRDSGLEGRLEVRGYGESRPREPNDTEEQRARNRRVEFAEQD